MKLSGKGIDTIFSALLKTIEERDLVFRKISQGVFKKHIEALNFEPDDFESPHPSFESQGIERKKDSTSHHIVLTVEEADEILEEFRLLIEAMDLCNYENGDFYDTDDAHKQLKVLRKRIEQAEVQDE